MNSKGFGGIGILVHSSFLDHEVILPTTNTHSVPHTTSQSSVARWTSTVTPTLSQQSLSSIEVYYFSNKKVTCSGTQPGSL